DRLARNEQAKAAGNCAAQRTKKTGSHHNGRVNSRSITMNARFVVKNLDPPQTKAARRPGDSLAGLQSAIWRDQTPFFPKWCGLGVLRADAHLRQSSYGRIVLSLI